MLKISLRDAFKKKIHYLGKFPNRGGGVNPKSQLYFLKKLGIFCRGGGVSRVNSQLLKIKLLTKNPLFWQILPLHFIIFTYINWEKQDFPIWVFICNFLYAKTLNNDVQKIEESSQLFRGGGGSILKSNIPNKNIPNRGRGGGGQARLGNFPK